MKLYDYQSRDIKEIETAFLTHFSVMYQLPTGGGKSVVSVQFIDNLYQKGKKVLVLAHRKELLSQFKIHFDGRKIETGKMIGKEEHGLDKAVVIASINTATRDKRLESLLEQGFDYIVVDEAHRIASESYNNVLDKVRLKNPDLRVLGLTATPYRKDRKNLGNYFETMICSDDVQTLIKGGYLANYKTFSTPVKNLDEEVDKNSGDYQLTQLSAYMKTKERIDYAIESYRLHGENRQMLVFCVDRSHAKAVVDAYRASNFVEAEETEKINEIGDETLIPRILTVGYLDGDTLDSERDQMLEAFRLGVLQIIVSIETLTEGVDLPETGCIQLLRPTLSLTLYMQMVGRGLRLKKDGSILIVLDNAGCSREFGLISSPKTWSLDPTVNPCSRREGNKVVARRKDGSYDEDLDSAEFLELEEFSYEEYLEKVIKDIGGAEKHNAEMEAKALKMLQEIGLWFIKKSGMKDLMVDPEDYRYFDNDIYIRKKGSRDGKFKIDIDAGRHQLDISVNTYSIDSYVNKIKYNVICGKFWELIEKDKEVIIDVVEKYKEAKKTNEAKIDVSKLKEASKQIEKNLFIEKINAYLQKNRIVEFKEDFRLSRWFQGSNDWKRAKRIVFAKNKLMYSNEIIIQAEDGEEIYTSKSTKTEKIVQMLEDVDVMLG